MIQFVISIKKNEGILNSFEKISFDLNPQKDIVKQAEEKVAALLLEASSGLQVADVAWKVYRYDGKRYFFVSCSENWVGE